ncbi:BamA/TamA family outer membrane protein [Prosthecobacter sp.]|uniref:BamA/OMP85 family outer membrane protein n=1 Tax=Prosthecobacter sp. TaxID=1965333 RepID=UPI001DB04D60|nr:BamA/TamA family outer membrane protein [Prosthecobacter sp.]MCB1275781.1 BamA/TamA family outer membrane protein [Prosthecobacter sp.]
MCVDGVDDAQWEDLKTMLMDQLTLNGGGPAGAPLADDLAFFTRQHFIREGWPDAEATWKLEPGGMRLTVTPGKAVRVGTVTLKGEMPLPEAELKKYLMKPTLEREDVDKKLPQWVEADMQQGAGLVQRRLRAEGYLNAETLLLPAPSTGPDMRRDLTLEIKPGPKFVFGNATIVGSPPELSKLTQEQMTEAEGTPFNEARVQQIQQRLESICSEHGWLHATTTADYTLGQNGGTVDVVFRIAPGERVRISRVTTHPGFSRGATRVLLAKFKPLTGQIYEAEEADFFFKRALDTGMFNLLDTKVLPENGNLAVGNLRITGEEAKPVTLGFELGFDTFLGGQAGVTYKNTNWRDTGNTLAAELSYSMAGPVGFVSLMNPAVFDSQHSATLRLALEQFNRFEYNRIGTALSLDVARRVDQAFSYSMFVGASANTVSSTKLTVKQTGPTDYSLMSLGGNLMYDRRDSAVLPKKGWYLSGRLESATDILGSGVSFIRTDLRGAWYRPITKKFRFATGAELSTIQGASAEKIPIDSRVFNGGPFSVRSFGQRKLGPVTPGGTPLGGTSALFASAEFSYEIMPNFEFAVFGDIGSLSQANNSSPLSYSSDFREAIGAGLRYHLPFGPIRIDYGHNPNRRTGESSGFLHVTVGFAF